MRTADLAASVSVSSARDSGARNFEVEKPRHAAAGMTGDNHCRLVADSDERVTS